MISKWLVFSLVLLLCSCGENYTNEQYVKDAKVCLDNGFDYYEVITEWDYEVKAVVCTKRVTK